MDEGLKKQALEWFERGDHEIETAQLLYDQHGYTANGQMNEAKKEFNAVLATNPPQVVGENIKRFLEMIEAQKNWYARVSVGFLSDSNVNAGPVAKSVLILGVPFELSTDTRERSFIAIF